jgi:excinuclease ABC subunit A
MPSLPATDRMIAAELVKEIAGRLGFLINVGLDYLSLSRKGPTLSGGESQRIRLASQVGSELTGVLYILDEPSIGLHQRDNIKLLEDPLSPARYRQHPDRGRTRPGNHGPPPTASWTSGPGAGHAGGADRGPRAPPRQIRSKRNASVTGQVSGRPGEAIALPATKAGQTPRQSAWPLDHDPKEPRKTTWPASTVKHPRWDCWWP